MTLKEELVQALIHYDMHAITRSYEAQAALLLDLMAKREIKDDEAAQEMANIWFDQPVGQRARDSMLIIYRVLQQRAMIVRK